MRSHGYAIEPERDETFVDHYYDTPDRQLLRAGWAYRARDRDGERRVDLREFAPIEGARAPEEVEQPVLLARTRSTELPSGPVREQLAALVNGARSREMFSIHRQRLLCAIVAPDDASTRIELAIDQSHVVAESAAKNAPGALDFTELDLELKDGSRESLERLTGILQAQADLLPARLSPFERGLQAAGLSAPLAELGPAPGAADPLLELAYYHLREQLDLMRAQQLRAWEGLDTDGVHQMRVATRRIRAALRTFKEILPPRRVATFDAEFRWVANALGRVRDLDVYRDDLAHYMAAIPPDDAQSLAPYHRYLVEQAQAARQRLIAVLGSRRYAKLMARFERFVVSGPSHTALRRFRTSAGNAVAEYVDKRLKSVLRHGRGIQTHMTADRLHALRIRCKRLRYTAEFFFCVAPDVLDRVIDETIRLQDFLGEHQDAWVASTRLRSYADTVAVRASHRALLLALGQLIQTQEQQATRQRERFRKAWRRFTKRLSRKKLRTAMSGGDADAASPPAR
jgi:CHAD domain-containing protein